MLRAIPALLFLLAGCGFAPSEHSGSSVTVTLPPPKAETPSPGFSTPVKAGLT